MKTLLLILATGLLAITTVAFPRTPKKMKAFTSERELRSYFQKVAEKQKLAYERKRASMTETVEVSSAETVESVTNTQVAGVDEGGIVKVYGDYLVLLRRSE